MGKNTCHHISDEGIVHKICKELMAQQEKKNPFKMSGGSEDMFPKSI